MMDLNKLYLMDCMDGMKQFPDKYFDLAIVDPPYGGGSQNGHVERESCAAGRQTSNRVNGAGSAGGLTDISTRTIHATGGIFARYEGTSQIGGIFDGADIKAGSPDGTWAAKYGNTCAHWDIAPPPEYFNELARVSKNQIIWGGNYFDLPPTRCFLIWRKLSISEGFSMAMCEYAWTSFNDNAKFIELAPQGKKDDKRFHPTQKPVELYTWILNMYGKQGDKILDTHAGSASSLVACEQMGFDYVGFEINEIYYKKAAERIKKAKAQGRIMLNKPQETQVKLF